MHGLLLVSSGPSASLWRSTELIHGTKNGWHADSDSTDPLIKDISLLTAAKNLGNRGIDDQSEIGVMSAHGEPVRLIGINFVNN